MDGEQRLAAINRLLAEKKLRPLTSLGSNDKGQPEIIDIDSWSAVNSRFFEDVFFVVRGPSNGQNNGPEYKHMVRFNANGAVSDGAIFIPVINGRVAVVQQFRPSLGVETWELPRGFSDKVDLIAKQSGDPRSLGIKDLPKVLARELGEEVVNGARVTALTAYGQIAENSGTHNVAPDAYLVDIEVDAGTLESRLGGSENLAIRLLTWGEIEKGEGVDINDLHSLAILALARRHRLRLRLA
jgi:hypothetical protein